MIDKTPKNISFSSGIKFVSTSEFSRQAGCIPEKYYVKYPWTAKETVKGYSAYTKDVKDCTMGAITDGRDVVMFHISPDKKNINNFEKIKKTILEKINLNNPELQAFILGSTEDNSMSLKLRLLIEEFMKKCNIKYSTLTGQKSTANTHVLYDSRKDDWVIASNLIDNELGKAQNSEDIAKKLFKNVSVADFDEFV